ncbi:MULTISPECIES: NAD(+) synthase [Methylobacterium]|uniref:Glutamine-dependent NAD(+) synthetase n=4 Tax=Pseudomonadota TaxID=1224 RepID=A0ABQ4SW49_9HYPH|nr:MULTISPECIES: NAD(+) synthase [Methylobacterium]PIU07587.1 MAG: NAD(+) synthase [Methylobacterium sp. CG09_land_8_20_14_0_10_71_15]PIU13873.1 MAG: NAD(+) synthase [Methylobacterium sp. CG08_land_8_20_14_0_20_71_15]GBU16532.1 NAD(+) synthase [Methylobacterium sp.]GJE06140.1 Glutamine-dependent NAD(+) synthetase [Methylobacterium jeotgali]
MNAPPKPAFRSLYGHGFARVAACTGPAHPAEPGRNVAEIVEAARDCHGQGAVLAVFPELGLSGYAIEDLFLQDALLDAVEAATAALVAASAAIRPLLVVGAPLRWRSRIYNGALAIQGGRLLGVVPKTYLPNYREFYEKRHFASGAGITGETMQVGGLEAPFGTDLLFAAEDLPGFTLGIEVCEDLWVPQSPGMDAALAGASVIANPSGSPITVGRAQSRELLTRAASMRGLCAYVYAAAGLGESTTDLSWDGQTSIDETGVRLAEGERFATGPVRTLADIDLTLIRQERLQAGSFDDNAAVTGRPSYRRIGFRLDPPGDDLGLMRRVERFPFVPADPARLAQDCYEAYNIQVAGLARRLEGIGAKRVVIGVSGGLDSTHALVVAAKAFDRLGLPRSGILAYTLPGFATSDATKGNAHALMQAMGVGAGEIDIRPAARQMLADMGHPFGRGEPVYDVTFENVQAGLRTDYLFRLANQNGAIVIGTGDLSELAVGWCTYGVGDQMSHYGVNAGVPKTLIQHLIRWTIGNGQFGAEEGRILQDILDTEISPELVPAGEGEAPQSTEAAIGPYALQDFNLFYTLRHGFPPSKIAFLALHAWGDAASGAWPEGLPEEKRVAYGLPEIRRWLRVFVGRFFGFSQFKRSAMPNGPKVSAGGALSPRGDWRAPSDTSARLWLEELDRNVPDTETA